MKKDINFQYLRNPLFIFGCFIFLLLPEFSILCRLNLNIHPFWSDLKSCSRQFVLNTFLENSIWSLLLLISVFEVFNALSTKLKLDGLPQKIKDWLRYELKLIVPLLVAFVIYTLLTYFLAWATNDRVLVLAEVNPWVIFKKVFFVCYLGINALLILNNFRFKKDPSIGNIVVQGPMGEKTIALKEIKWFEKKGRNYFANTGESEFGIKQNLLTLEKMLCKKHFARINRSVIAKVDSIKGYSYWENEKYVLQMDVDQEFIVTRKRIVELKSVINN